MVIKNHISYRFLTDDSLAVEIMDTMYPEELKKALDKNSGDDLSGKLVSLFQLVSKDNQKAFYITETVLDKLDMLKVKKKHTEGVGEHYDWTVFKNVADGKTTFIFPDNSLLRMHISDNILHFCHLNFEKREVVKGDGRGYVNWVLFYVDRSTGEQCDHFQSNDVKRIETFIYKLLCFIYLSDNEEVIVQPGRKYGTKRTGNLLNSFSNIPLTIVNSKWNVTSISTEAFSVRGHFALRWTGEARQTPRMVFIQPFEKGGYVRQSGKDSADL